MTNNGVITHGIPATGYTVQDGWSYRVVEGGPDTINCVILAASIANLPTRTDNIGSDFGFDYAFIQDEQIEFDGDVIKATYSLVGIREALLWDAATVNRYHKINVSADTIKREINGTYDPVTKTVSKKIVTISNPIVTWQYVSTSQSLHVIGTHETPPLVPEIREPTVTSGTVENEPWGWIVEDIKSDALFDYSAVASPLWKITEIFKYIPEFADAF